MIKNPNRGKYSLLEVDKDSGGYTKNGKILLPTPEEVRNFMREKSKETSITLSLDERPDDNYMWGKLIDGKLEIGDGNYVLFNKFDAEPFEVEGKQYYRILNANALAYYV